MIPTAENHDEQWINDLNETACESIIDQIGTIRNSPAHLDRVVKAIAKLAPAESLPTRIQPRKRSR